MPTPLVPQHYPDDFYVFDYHMHSAIGTENILFYADRDVAIDSITMGIYVVGSSTSLITIKKTTGGTLASPKSAVAATLNTNGVALITAQSADTGGTFLPDLLTPSSDTNIIKAGNFVYYTASGTTSTIRGLIQIRYRSRIG